MTDFRVQSAYHVAANPSNMSEGPVISLDFDLNTRKYSLATIVHDEVNSINGISPNELRNIGLRLIAEADNLPAPRHAAKCPAVDGNKCVCGA